MKKFGICHLSVAPLRIEPSDRSEIISQILFGESFEILEEQVKWTKIRCLWDDYEAFIDVKQYKVVDERTANLSLKSKLNSLPISNIRINNLTQYLSIGSVLNNNTIDLFNIEFNENDWINANDKKLPSLTDLSKAWLKTPYLWGGRSIFGIDCSGFTQNVFKFFGCSIPRDAYQQAEVGAVVNFIEEAKPGDVAFFDNDEHKIIHVGIIIENQQIIHASGEVRIDKIDHQGIFNEDIQRYTHKLRIIKRFIA